MKQLLARWTGVMFGAVVIVLPGCGGGGAVALAERLGSLDQRIDSRIREAVDSEDYFAEKAGREARIAAKTLAIELADEKDNIFRDVDDQVQQGVIQLEQQVAELARTGRTVVEMRELAYLDLQNLANFVLPGDWYVLTSVEGFSQHWSVDGRPHKFLLRGNPFQIGNDTRVAVKIDGHVPRDLSIRRANIVEFSVPHAALATRFADNQTVRVPFELVVEQRRPKSWYRWNPQWTKVYEYSDPQGVLLLPKYPAKVKVEELYAVDYIDQEELKSLVTTIRVGSSGSQCKNDDHSCARSCVNCKVACIDLPEGAQLVRAQAWKIDAKYGKVKSHNKGGSKSGPICAQVANWRDSKSATFGYKIEFYPSSERTETRSVGVYAVEIGPAVRQPAAEGRLRFGEPYEVRFDPKGFVSYNLNIELFTGERIWLSKGATHDKVSQEPDFGGPLLKRLRFTLLP